MTVDVAEPGQFHGQRGSGARFYSVAMQGYEGDAAVRALVRLSRLK